MLFEQRRRSEASAIWRLPLGGGGKPVPLLEAPFVQVLGVRENRGLRAAALGRIARSRRQGADLDGKRRLAAVARRREGDLL